MKKTITKKCKVCGDVEITFFEGTDGELSIPVEICPTLKDVERYYKEIVGETYEDMTGGEKVKNSFEKGIITPSHKSFEDDGFEEAKRHTLEPIECWCEIS